MKLISEWRQAHKWLSVQIPIVGGAVLASYACLPEDWKAAIPHWVIVSSAITFLFGGALGRVIEQQPKKEPEE